VAIDQPGLEVRLAALIAAHEQARDDAHQPGHAGLDHGRPPPDNDGELTADTVEEVVFDLELVVALREAWPHVHRQQHGSHDQDRADARAWLDRWAHLRRRLAIWPVK